MAGTTKEEAPQGETAADRLDALLRRTAVLAGYAADRKAKGQAKQAKQEAKAAAATAKGKREAGPLPPGSPSRARRMVTEEEEDERLVKDEEEAEDGGAPSYLTVQPSVITGKMREYQMEALNWMIGLHDRGLNGILADEMGLGKTLESISMLGYLAQYRGIRGPHIVIVPKSTSSNWLREFNRWCPSLSVFKFHGSKEERAEQRKLVGTTDVLITTYEVAIIEKGVLAKVNWEYLYIDEAHRIKNEQSLLSQIVRTFPCKHRILVTGTPLQNNLRELWALLNFLLPDVFDSSVDFESWFQIGPDAKVGGGGEGGGDGAADGDGGGDTTERDAIVSKLHRVLRPFLLRRLKSDVEKSLLPKIETNLYVGLSEMQREWYTRILKKDIDALNTSAKRSGGGKQRLLNIVMQLRKVCNHPYLFDGAEPGPPYVEGEHLIENSGKMMLLDKLLRRLKEQGSRVLIFSQMTRLLDILEDYCRYREFEYCRIDGSTSQDDRDDAMDAYNAPGSSKFVFLLSTRAGGLGINLQTADTVVLYDSDWNPQMDLQAQDRAHRIGQKKQVHVYRFVSENTMEEKIVQRAYEKLFLDAVVIQQGRLMDDAKKKKLTPDELQAMVRFGANQIFQAKGATVTDEDIEAILSRGAERTKVLNENMKRNVDTNLLSFKSDGGAAPSSVYQYEGKDFRNEQAGGGGAFGDSQGFIDMGQRERKTKLQSFDTNQYFREALRQGEAKPAGPREFRPSVRPDYQFFQNDRLEQLERKEWEARERLRHLVREDRERRKAERAAEREAERQRRRDERKAARLAARKAAGEGDDAGDDDEDDEDEDDDEDEKSKADEDDDDEDDDDVDDDDEGDNAENSDAQNGKGASAKRPRADAGTDAGADTDGPRTSKRAKTGAAAGAAAAETPLSPRSARREAERTRREELRAQAGSLTKKEQAEKERLLAEGFGTWQRRHLMAMVRAMERYGRDDTEHVFASVEGKTPAEVEEYYNVFWQRVGELKNGDKLVAQVERGEERIQREAEKRALVRAKVKKYKDPYNTLEIPYSAGHKGKSYNEDEDRFIVCALDEIGWGAWDELKRRIRGAWQFRFDWYFKSRTTSDLARRADFLLKLLEKEAAKASAKGNKKRSGGGGGAKAAGAAKKARKK